MKAQGLVSFAASLVLAAASCHAAAYDGNLVAEAHVEARAGSGVPSTGPGVLSFLKQHLGDARSFCSSYTPHHPTVTTTKLATRTSTVRSTSTSVRTITRTVTATRETTTTTRTKVSLRTELDKSVREAIITTPTLITRTIPSTVSVVTIPYQAPVRRSPNIASAIPEPFQAAQRRNAAPFKSTAAVLERQAPRLLSSACSSLFPCPRATVTHTVRTVTSTTISVSTSTTRTTVTQTPKPIVTTDTETSISFTVVYTSTETAFQFDNSYTPTYTPTTATIFDVCATPTGVLPSGVAFIIPEDSQGDIQTLTPYQDPETCCTICLSDPAGCNGWSIDLTAPSVNNDYLAGFCVTYTGNPANGSAEFPGDNTPTPQCPKGKPAILTFDLDIPDLDYYTGPCAGNIAPLD